MGSAGVQACYSHNLISQERHMVQILNRAAQQAPADCMTPLTNPNSCSCSRHSHAQIYGGIFHFREVKKKASVKNVPQCSKQCKQA